MGKASKRKRQHAEERSQPAAYPPPPPWAAPLLLAAALAGIGLSATSTWVHYRVASTDGGYTSFCNVSEAVNCDTVVTSAYGSLFGIPVSVWAVAFYAVLAIVAWRVRSAAADVRDHARADALALAVGGAAFSSYLAVVSLGVLRTVCLLCAGLYVVAALSLFAAVKLAAPVADAVPRLRDRWRAVRSHPALASGGAAAVALVLFLPGWLGAPTRMTREEVFRANPKFYDWYTSQPVVDPTIEGGNAIGPGDAPVQLVEFSDFECPHCSRAHVMLKDVLSRYRNEVRFVFHHFPLSSECNDSMQGQGHEHACEAAVASECAAEAGRFEAFANLLFANQGALGPEALKRYAREADVPEAEFARCIAAGDAAKRVQADVAAGKLAGVRSTPTFFINGRKIEGNLTYENWLLALAVELDR